MQSISSYLSPLFGGFLIGCSALLLMLVLGRITGISGIASSLLNKGTTDKVWRLVFIIGIIIGALLLQLIMPKSLPFRAELSSVVIVVAGLLVVIFVLLLYRLAQSQHLFVILVLINHYLDMLCRQRLLNKV